jgi:hypothetical protein
VSVAISFRGKEDDTEGIYATYATFDPSSRRGLIDAVDWMRDEYVESYEGVVLTDFDQQENHFPEAKFSLNKVMNLELKRTDFKIVQIHNVEKLIASQKIIRKQYTVKGGNVGALGDNARAENFTQNAPAPRSARKRRLSTED